MESVLDVSVVELYFPAEVAAKTGGVLAPVRTLLADAPSLATQSFIRHANACAASHPLRQALDKMQGVEVVNIVKEKG